MTPDGDTIVVGLGEGSTMPLTDAVTVTDTTSSIIASAVDTEPENPEKPAAKPAKKMIFLDLPTEILNRFYDEGHKSRDLWSMDRGSMRAPALAQVNRKLRSEYLANYHAYHRLSLMAPPITRAPTSILPHTADFFDVWAGSRVPLTKSFRLCTNKLRGDEEVALTIDLSGNEPGVEHTVKNAPHQTQWDKLVKAVVTRRDDGSLYMTPGALWFVLVAFDRVSEVIYWSNQGLSPKKPRWLSRGVREERYFARWFEDLDRARDLRRLSGDDVWRYMGEYDTLEDTVAIPRFQDYLTRNLTASGRIRGFKRWPRSQ